MKFLGCFALAGAGLLFVGGGWELLAVAAVCGLVAELIWPSLKRPRKPPTKRVDPDALRGDSDDPDGPVF